MDFIIKVGMKSVIFTMHSYLLSFNSVNEISKLLSSYPWRIFSDDLKISNAKLYNFFIVLLFSVHFKVFNTIKITVNYVFFRNLITV